MSNNKLKIGISVGDINGIGLEVILKTLSDKRMMAWCIPVLYCSTKVASYHKNITKIKELTLHNAKDIHSLNHNSVNVINCWMENVKITLGKCTAEGGKYASFSLDQASEDLKAGHIDALVTAPINKKAMNLSGFEFPGHTEYLTNKFEAEQNLMLMVHEDLRVGLVTNHLPISQISQTITEELVLQKILLFDKTLRMDFGIEKPAIAILGLNPHAGDSGVLGNEEIEIIAPAIEKAKSKGVLAIGSYAADGFFGSDNYLNFDGILAMYHDQGLAPFKTLSFGSGINFTAGLSIIRTSPDHGTGYDIAGKNVANPQSFRQALYLAIDSCKQRAEYLEMTSNPLKEIDLKEYDKKQGKYSGRSKGKKKDSNNSKNITEEESTKEETKRKTKELTTDDNSQLTVEERLELAAKKKEAEQRTENELLEKDNNTAEDILNSDASVETESEDNNKEEVQDKIEPELIDSTATIKTTEKKENTEQKEEDIKEKVVDNSEEEEANDTISEVDTEVIVEDMSDSVDSEDKVKEDKLS